MPQETDDGKLKRRIAEFARMFEPKHIRKPMNMMETLKEAKQEGKVIVSNREFDLFPDAIDGATGSIKIWTGTLIIAQREGRRFGEQITTSSDLYNPFNFHFVVPKALRDKIGGCIVLEHPDFEFLLVGPNTYQVIPSGTPQYLPGFPNSSGLFRFEGELGLPIGEKTKENDVQTLLKTRKRPDDLSYKEWRQQLEAEFEMERRNTRILSTEYGAYIGLVVRDLSSRRTISASVRASEKLRSFVCASITPENFVEHVLQRLQNAGDDQQMKIFIYDWISADPVLADGINRHRLRNLFKDE